MQQRLPNVTLVNLEGVSALVGKAHWFDEAAYFTSKQPFSLREMPLAAAYFARLIASGHGLIRKCLVLDLDNTLWGGVIGDDGVGGIRLDPAEPTGEAFRSFQRYLLLLKQRGVLLAVCSKNDRAIAVSAFEHDGMLLKIDDFSAFVANWDDKASNLKLIAQKLNIGMDTLVFFDDNPAERALVQQFAPGVLVIDVPEDPALYVRALDLSFAFEWPQLTAEDINRTDSYLKDLKREELQEQFTNYDLYLSSLDMKASIEIVEAGSVDRVCQLMNKTNQFNLRTQRYGEQAMAQMLSSPQYCVLQARFEDRFSKYGVMASAVVRFAGKLAFIENWVMSCRVFKRGLEDAMINSIAEVACSRGCDFLFGEYIATAKNAYVANMFERFKFEKLTGDSLETFPVWLTDGCVGALYRQDLRQFARKAHRIEIMSSNFSLVTSENSQSKVAKN
jgi:FkbH-like protein